MRKNRNQSAKKTFDCNNPTAHNLRLFLELIFEFHILYQCPIYYILFFIFILNLWKYSEWGGAWSKSSMVPTFVTCLHRWDLSPLTTAKCPPHRVGKTFAHIILNFSRCLSESLTNRFRFRSFTPFYSTVQSQWVPFAVRQPSLLTRKTESKVVYHTLFYQQMIESNFRHYFFIERLLCWI